MKLSEELAPAVKTGTPEQLQLPDNAAIASNAPYHSTRPHCDYNWPARNPTIVLPHEPAIAVDERARDQIVMRQDGNAQDGENVPVFNHAELPAPIGRFARDCFGHRTLKPLSRTRTIGPLSTAQPLARGDR
jgi:hypothetical protein